MKNKITYPITILALFFVLTLVPVIQNYGQHQRMSLDDRVKHLTAALSLSKPQADSLRAVLATSEKERSRIYNEHNGDRAAMRDEMMKLMGSTDTKIEAMLNAEQKEKYEAEKRYRMSGAEGTRPKQAQQHADSTGRHHE